MMMNIIAVPGRRKHFVCLVHGRVANCFCSVVGGLETARPLQNQCFEVLMYHSFICRCLQQQRSPSSKCALSLNDGKVGDET